MSINFTDTSPIGTFKDTADGYIVATSRIARTGVQEYLASEIGLIGDHIVKVNRPESEVFHKDTFASLARVPITVDHPNEPVTSDNWSDLAVGEVGDSVLRDGDYVVVNPMIKDTRGVDAAKTTHREISMGYTADLVPVSDAALPYEFEQTNIRYNHLALVPKGRAGSKARIADSADNWGASPVITDKEAPKVAFTKVKFGDATISVEDADVVTLEKVLADHKAELDAKDAEKAAVDVELADAKSKVLTDEQLAEKVKEFADAQMKLEAVKAKHGEDFVKDKSAAYIDAAYDLLPKEKDKAAVALGDKAKTAGDDPWAKFDNTKGAK
jgi:uncharacterized protein